MSTRRASSLNVRLAKIGFAEPSKAAGILAEPAFVPLIDPLDDLFGDGLLEAFADCADPDLAILGLSRLLALLPEHSLKSQGQLLAQLRRDSAARRRLLAVLGASAALTDFLARHPEAWEMLAGEDDNVVGAWVMQDELLQAVTPSIASADWPAALNALRVAYFRRLLAIAARDLTCEDPMDELRLVSQDLADLASAALEAALAVARAQVALSDPVASEIRMVILGMGKTGGRELNYISDVDVIYVVEPAADRFGEPGAEDAALRAGAKMAAVIARICSTVTFEGSLWEVDANLRPEGKDGPLVRTLESHLNYYERWASTWEFQALMKARPIAGDQQLGGQYLQAITPMVWRAAERENFVNDVRAMRRRVVDNIPARDAQRQLKLGPGGLRDVEFSAQLLQLVHGRADEELRTGNTLEALRRLADGGYVGREDYAALDSAYRFMRVLEHRIQLFKLKRTHVVPDDPSDLRRLGRSLGYRGGSAQKLEEDWRKIGREVRRLHEKLFYRPLLNAVAALSPDEVRLNEASAQARLSALGYVDSAAALRHLSALTTGVSRRSALQRQILPVMLGWFADGPQPDAGLLAFRNISESLGSTDWYLRMLRDTSAAAERLASVLSSSRLVAEWMQRAPETVSFLADDDQLRSQAGPELMSAARTAAQRHENAQDAVLAARGVRRRELVRIGIADLVGLIDIHEVGQSLSNAVAAVIHAALEVAIAEVSAALGEELPTRIAVIGMGRLGGGELGYGSDADVLIVHDPLPGADRDLAQKLTVEVTEKLRRLLGSAGAEPALEVDLDLRPEGRNGPLVRSLESFAEYYARWSLPWETQALTRARGLAGDEDLTRRFMELIDPLRYPAGGLPTAGVREIRRIKARVESERLPRGVDPTLHLKLGRGGLSDVEWVIQLWQLRFADRVPELRTASTMQALSAAVESHLIDADDAVILSSAWEQASALRNAITHWRGRSQDSLPTNIVELEGIASICGYPSGSGSDLLEDYRRQGRMARTVFERVFYDDSTMPS